MRIAIFTVSLPLAIAAVGCSDVECSMSEIKVADECYPLRERDAGVVAAADGSTTESASTVDASAERDAGRDAERSPPREEQPAARADASAAEGSKDATVADVIVPPSTAEDTRDADVPRVDAAVATPAVADTGGTCVRAAEVCDGVDNDCNGQVDDTVGTAWYRDCDGDGFAVNAVGKVEGCAKPAPASGCAGWTQRDPANPAEQDCDDAAAQRFPGAGFGLATQTSADLNCDGKTESKVEYRGSNLPLLPGLELNLNLCQTREECDCWEVVAVVVGYEGFEDGGTAIKATSTIPYFTGRTSERPPCSALQDDALALRKLDRSCDTDNMHTVIVRNLCR